MGATAIIVIAITAAGILGIKSLTEALFYAQTIEKLLAAQKENDGMQITKIVITGGPCAGKTTGMGRIQKEFVKLGYKVLFVPETATELITGGVAPWTLVSNEEYQKMFTEGTHFNPVDLVCAVKDYKGQPFNLPEFVDKTTGFISSKSKNGKELKALELPGLWNGAMSNWNTVFVEVPLGTFNPVKTVNDLLREQHQ